MAVEAHHHLLHNAAGGGGPQKLIHAGWVGGGGYYDAAAASTSPLGRYYYGAAGGDVAAVARQSQQPLLHQPQQPLSCVGVAAAPVSTPPPMMMVPGQYGGQVCAAPDASESGVTFGGAQEAMMMAEPYRKRKRVTADDEQARQVLDTAGVAAHLQQQLVDVDRLVVQHTARMWAEMTEQRRRHARQVVAAVSSVAAKRLRAKDEEIARVGRLNWALEERVRSLLVETQVWRDLAQSNEAAASALRADLQTALDAQQARGLCGYGGGPNPAAALGGENDAESCCCGENDVAAVAAGDGQHEEEEVGTPTALGRCRVCGEGAAEALLMPCRHLCACAACADSAVACPTCGCATNGSLCINFS